MRQPKTKLLQLVRANRDVESQRVGDRGPERVGSLNLRGSLD